MLEDDTCTQDSNNNAVPTGLDLYDTPKRFEMVSLYCMLSYRPVCSVYRLHHIFMEPLLCVQIQLQLTQRLHDSMICYTKYCYN